MTKPTEENIDDFLLMWRCSGHAMHVLEDIDCDLLADTVYDFELEIIKYGRESEYVSPSLRGCTIYLVKDKDTGLTKIGRTGCIKQRFKQLSLLHNIELVGTLENMIFSDEDTLHKKFLKKRVHGEWFKLTQKDIDSALAYEGVRIPLIYLAIRRQMGCPTHRVLYPETQKSTTEKDLEQLCASCHRKEHFVQTFTLPPNQ